MKITPKKTTLACSQMVILYKKLKKQVKKKRQKTLYITSLTVQALPGKHNIFPRDKCCPGEVLQVSWPLRHRLRKSSRQGLRSLRAGAPAQRRRSEALSPEPSLPSLTVPLARTQVTQHWTTSSGNLGVERQMGWGCCSCNQWVVAARPFVWGYRTESQFHNRPNKR